MLAGVATAAALVPAAASAHATLEGTQPGRGATVAKAPAQVVFRFDETVEGNFGAVRVFNGKGERVDQGDAFHPAGSGPRLGVHLKPNLPRGTYTATYRVVSADSHIVSGGFVFSVGHAGAAPGETVSQLLGKSKTGPVTKIAFGAARALQFASIGVVTGALVFLLVAWLPALRALAGGSTPWRTASEVLARRIRILMLVACVTGALSALAGVVLEAAEAAGVSGFAALRPHILSEVFDTRFGGAWTAAAACWVVLGSLVTVVLRPAARRAPVLQAASLGADGLAVADSRRTMAAALGLPLVVLLLVPAFSGHGSTQSPVPLMFGSITLHVTAMSVWLGGLVALVFALPRATRELGPTERTRLVSAVVSRFSPLALGAVIVLLASGLVQAYVEVRHLHLLTSTNFGVAVLIKFCLLLVLIGLGALNRQRTVPRLRALGARRGIARPGGGDPAAHAAHRGGGDRGGARCDRGAGQLRARHRAVQRTGVGHHLGGRQAAAVHAGPGPRRVERAAPVPAGRQVRRPVRRRQAGERGGVAARQAHRTAAAERTEVRPRPLHGGGHGAERARHVAHQDRRAGGQVRPGHHHAEGAGPVTGLWAPALHVVLLYVAPAALLALALLSGHYPGERVLTRLARRGRRRPRRAVSAPRPRAVFTARVTGGVLLATGMAGRAPPPPSR